MSDSHQWTGFSDDAADSIDWSRYEAPRPPPEPALVVAPPEPPPPQPEPVPARAPVTLGAPPGPPGWLLPLAKGAALAVAGVGVVALGSAVLAADRRNATLAAERAKRKRDESKRTAQAVMARRSRRDEESDREQETDRRRDALLDRARPVKGLVGALRLIEPTMRGLDYEVFAALALGADGDVVDVRLVAGNARSVEIDVDALRAWMGAVDGAAKLYTAHSHPKPARDPRPSPEDRATFETLRELPGFVDDAVLCPIDEGSRGEWIAKAYSHATSKYIQFRADEFRYADDSDGEQED